MPQSPDEIISAVLRRVGKFKKCPGTVMDLGCGWGKFGRSLKEKYPDIEIDGVEIFLKNASRAINNVTELGVQVYRQVFVEDVVKVSVDLYKYDLIIALELLDKLEKEQAICLIKKLKGKLIFSLPLIYYDGNMGDKNPFEVSLSRFEHGEVMKLAKTCIFKSLRYAVYFA